ncbi:MBL fold metallo-hydrolase [Mycobacterium sp. 1100029.7]|nr:MBL fold metallo-hydrolase [Mycobacterium sp. 1100029.7]
MRFTWERLTPSVYRCRIPFCDVTIGLVRGRDGALLVDTGTTLTEATAIDEDVRQLTGTAVTHIVLTHKHFDHVLGCSHFRGADIYCAPEVVDYLSSGQDQLRDDALRHGADEAEIDRAIAAIRPPECGIYDAVVELGDRAVRITHPGRGHTTSDLIVVVPGVDHYDDRVVMFTGDLVEESADPAIDADSDVVAWPATLDRVRAIGGRETIYVPGHGNIVDAEFIRRQRAWLQRRSG